MWATTVGVGAGVALKPENMEPRVNERDPRTIWSVDNGVARRCEAKMRDLGGTKVDSGRV